MMKLGGVIRGSVPVVLLVLACLGAGVASAEEWNAERALELAVELEDTLAQALEAAKTAPPQETAMQERTRDGAVVEMKYAHRASRELVTQLRIGAGRDATEPLLRGVRTTYESAIETAENAVAQTTVAPLLEKAESLMRSLQKRYAQGGDRRPGSAAVSGTSQVGQGTPQRLFVAEPLDLRSELFDLVPAFVGAPLQRR